MKKSPPVFTQETQALHYRVDNAMTDPVTTPIYQNSAFSADSPYFYTRKSNPNSVELETAMSLIENCETVISTTTGMSAITLSLSLLNVGDHLVINKDIYGCSLNLFRRLAVQLHLQLTILDLSHQQGRDQIPDDVSMMFFETPTNPFLKTIPIKEIADSVHRKNANALVVVDNSWATPLFQKPLQFGADISVMSATKFISGHSDVMGGLVSTDNKQLAKKIADTRFYSGAILDPHSAWLMRRSLQTFPLRMREHVTTTRRLYEYLQTEAVVAKTWFPHIDGTQLQQYGGILFFEFSESAKINYKEFAESLQLFATGTAMACVTSMVAQPWSGSHASLSEKDKETMGISKNLVRLCFGLESAVDLINDLASSFKLFNKNPAEAKPELIQQV